MSESCKWHESDDETNCWHTDCGDTFQITEGSPADNNMRHCCYCGNPLVEVPHTPEDEP